MRRKIQPPEGLRAYRRSYRSFGAPKRVPFANGQAAGRLSFQVRIK